MGLLHSIATQWPNPSLFLEHSPQLSAKSPLCIVEWNMQQFNMDFTCHAVYPESTSAARIWVRRCQKISVGKIWGEARDSVYVFLNIMVSALGCHQSKSSWIFAKKSCIYIYVSECLTFEHQKTVLHWLWALPTLGSCACDIHRMGRFWPRGRGVVLLHLYCIWCHLNQEGVGMKITYQKKHMQGCAFDILFHHILPPRASLPPFSHHFFSPSKSNRLA